MNRFIPSFIFCLLCIAAAAQDLSTCQEVIGTSGGSSVEQGLVYSYTIGEPVILTLRKDNVNFILTQGFHQPDVCLPVSTDDEGALAAWDIQVYPNPTQQFLRIQITAPVNSGLIGEVYDMNGQLLLDNIDVNRFDGVNIDCTAWQAGAYIVRLRMADDDTATATVRFMKL